MKIKITLIYSVVFSFFLVVFGNPGKAYASDELYTAIREGRAVAMMRHAIAPGGGDPSNFKLGDCKTQRNLSGEGREQARKIGEAFRANGITTADVLTSQWCRCVDTANLLNVGEVTEYPALNSFFQNRSQGPAQTEALRQFLKERQSTQPVILVTHQVNVTAMTDIFPTSGEVVVFTLDEAGIVSVLGSLFD